MINIYDLKRSIKAAEQKGHELWFKLSDDENSILDSKTGEYICKTETYLQHLREKLHCDFENIYYEHASLTNIYRCRQCGTVIFGGDDERFNPNERCPTCCNDPSVTWNEYWTKEEIDSDPEKQKTIQAYIKEQARMDREYKRREARGGLYDFERSKKKFTTKKHGYTVRRINYGYDGDTGKTCKPADRFIEIAIWNKDDGIHQKTITIPLSFYAIWIRWIYPYSRKCHPDVRKYTFWQKKPKKRQYLAVGETIYVNFATPELIKDPAKMKVTSIEEDSGGHLHYMAEGVGWNHKHLFCKDDIWKTVFTSKKVAERCKTT